MSLHICNKSPTENSALRSSLAVASSGAGNAVLLIENAVYAVLPSLAQSLDLAAASSNIRLYALTDDLQARGLLPLAVDYVTAINYAEFVQLCVAHKNSHTWY